MKKLIAFFISTLLISCGAKEADKETSIKNHSTSVIQLTGEQISSLGLTTGLVKQDSISAILRINGKIDVPPQNMVSVSIPLGGYLKSTHLLPGMKVTKGEIIATIEDQQYIQLQQEYLSAKAKLNYAENEFQRQKELNSSKASSDKVYQQAFAEYTTQKIMVKSLSEKLKLISVDPEQLNEANISRSISVYAPISGYVTKINANIGKYVNPADVVFELVNPSDIHLALTIFEKDINMLHIGQKLKAFNNTNPEKKYDCEVLLIGQSLSAERNIEVHCHFKNYDDKLIPGMYMNAEIEVKSAKASLVPEESVVYYEGKSFVFVQKERDLFELTEINKGMIENGMVELGEAKNLENANIVTKGAYALLMALKNKQQE